ncbi:RDD family protein [Amycolatopsis sp. VS8301801F10]|uniref:RDD family protein n=1 Tax=Amycolatopsis sp. VS8301801F10 TaxID=2652442 RepID=UPI0038FC6F85
MTYPYGQPGGPPPGGPSFGAPPGYPQPYGPARVYADWGQRAGAYLIDFAPLLAGLLLAVLVSLVSGAAGTIVYLLAVLGTLAWTVFNRWINGGNTGQSLGKRIVGLKLVSEATGEPIGAGMAFVRDLAHALDSMAFALGFLWPLWDDKAQTFSDKILGTVVVPAEPAAAPGGGFARPGGFGQPGGFPGQPGGFGQPGPAAGFPGQPGGWGQPAQPGGFGQPGLAPQPGFGQPVPGGFPGQPSPNAGFPAAPQGFAAPQPGFGQPPVPGTPPQQAFGQPGPAPFDQPEPTQVVRPPAPPPPSEASGHAERTQVVQPAGEPEATQMITPETPKPGPAQS